MTRDSKEIVSALESFGGNLASSSSRETITFSGEALRSHLPQVLELASDSIVNPRFAQEEIQEQAEFIVAESDEAIEETQDNYLVEILHEVFKQKSPNNHQLAFAGHPLARTSFANKEVLMATTTDSLKKFHQYPLSFLNYL